MRVDVASLLGVRKGRIKELIKSLTLRLSSAVKYAETTRANVQNEAV